MCPKSSTFDREWPLELNEQAIDQGVLGQTNVLGVVYTKDHEVVHGDLRALIGC